MEVTAGNDGALAAGITLAATMQFVLTRLRTLVPTWPTEFSIALLKKMYTLPYQGAPGGGKRLNYGSRLDVGLPPTKLLLRLTEQLLHVQQMVFVEATFPSTVKHSVLFE